jgi:uncharacterized membrane protein YfcA
MIDPHILMLLFLVAVTAGLVDSIAGGGGLLALPALLLAGFNPVAALATNKLQGSFGTGSAVLAFARHGHVDVRANAAAVAATFIAAAFGVLAVSWVPTSWLAVVMPVMLVVLAIYFALSPRLSNEDAKPRMSAGQFAGTAAPAIGFYDGVFGPGAGSFYLLSYVVLRGYGIIKATAHTKLLNFTSNIASLIVFALGGQVVWIVGIVMGIGQFLGAQVGSRLAIRNGAKLIRPLLVVICCAMAIRLLMNPQNPLWQ